MTTMDRPVTRRTIQGYTITLTGAYPSPSGRRLVATLRGDGAGDWLEIREAGRRQRVVLDIAGLYRKGLIAQAKQRKGKQ
jgi:hypothetical protein